MSFIVKYISILCIIWVFLGLSVLDLGPMYVTQTDRRQTKSSLNAPAEADLWFLVPWARFPDCAPPLSDGLSDDGFQLTLFVSKFTF